MLKITDIHVPTKKDSGLVTGVPRNYALIEGRKRRLIGRATTTKLTRLMRKTK